MNECKSVCPTCGIICVSGFKCDKGEHWHWQMIGYQTEKKHEWTTEEEDKQQMNLNNRDELHKEFFMLKEREINASIAVGNFIRNCKHVIVRDSFLGAQCKICWKDFGWYCPKNPNAIYCEYDHNINSYGCKHCGVSSERK